MIDIKLQDLCYSTVTLLRPPIGICKE